MTEEQLKAMMVGIESSWQKQSDDLMASYMQRYQELSRQAVQDMQNMIATAATDMQKLEKPEPVHMRWMKVEGQNVLLLSEKAGKDILGAFDAIGKLLPVLKKLAKAK